MESVLASYHQTHLDSRTHTHYVGLTPLLRIQRHIEIIRRVILTRLQLFRFGMGHATDTMTDCVDDRCHGGQNYIGCQLSVTWFRWLLSNWILSRQTIILYIKLTFMWLFSTKLKLFSVEIHCVLKSYFSPCTFLGKNKLWLKIH